MCTIILSSLRVIFKNNSALVLKFPDPKWFQDDWFASALIFSIERKDGVLSYLFSEITDCIESHASTKIQSYLLYLWEFLGIK